MKGSANTEQAGLTAVCAERGFSRAVSRAVTMKGSANTEQGGFTRRLCRAAALAASRQRIPPQLACPLRSSQLPQMPIPRSLRILFALPAMMACAATVQQQPPLAEMDHAHHAAMDHQGMPELKPIPTGSLHTAADVHFMQDDRAPRPGDSYVAWPKRGR